jgi:predicted extracellular nuclease
MRRTVAQQVFLLCQFFAAIFSLRISPQFREEQMPSRALLALLLGLSAIAVQAQADVTINEIRIDQPSSDNDEYFELAGPPGTSLDGLTYVVIGDGTGGSGGIEAVVDLNGRAIPASGHFVAAEDTFMLAPADLTTNLNFENSDNVTHLLVEGFSGANNDDLDTDDDGVLDTTPWSAIVDSVALIETVGSGEQVYSSTTVGPDNGFVPGHVFRCPDETGVWDIGDTTLGVDDTPGAVNSCQSSEPAITLIHDIQGDGTDSPLVGATVTIAAVVVGDFQASGELSGFFLQEEDADTDDDPATSEGIFVLTDANVALGDLVQVTGAVDEVDGLTALTGVSNVSKLSAGNALPAATDISLPVNDVADLEAFEGMLVQFPQALVISEYSNFDRFGEIVLAWPFDGEGRLFQPTAVEEPGSTAAADRTDYNLRSRIVLDDGRTVANPDPARHPDGNDFALNNRFRGGDTVANVVGVLDYRFEHYRIQPTEGADYAAVNMRLPPPDLAGARITVASFNVLNYFTTLDEGGDLCGPPGFEQGCRGADDAQEFERQRTKTINALSQLDADIVGLIELENNGGAAIADLAQGLNDALGAGTYDYIDTGYVGNDVIAVGLIYKPATVLPDGDFEILDAPEFLNPNTPDDPKNRAALAQTFADSASGGRFTVVVNHFKSKGSGCGADDDDSEQGNCNGTRTEAAEALMDWLGTDPTESGDSDFLIIGDLNAYDKEDPIVALEAEGYVDLLGYYQGELAYDFVFEGQLGYLDYALANETLSGQVTKADVWHINADEPDILDYDTSFKEDAQDALYEPNAFRSSDHDPVIVGLNLNAPPDCAAAYASEEILWPPNHRTHRVDVEGVTDPDGDLVTVTVTSVFQDEPLLGRGSGWTGPDAWILDGGARLRAERDGHGNGRVYYLEFTAEDGQGNSCMGQIKVGVPKNGWKGHEPIDDGARYDSTRRTKRHGHDHHGKERHGKHHHGKDHHDKSHHGKHYHGKDHHGNNHSSWYASIRDWVERKISNYKSHRNYAHKR